MNMGWVIAPTKPTKRLQCISFQQHNLLRVSFGLMLLAGDVFLISKKDSAVHNQLNQTEVLSLSKGRYSFHVRGKRHVSYSDSTKGDKNQYES